MSSVDQQRAPAISPRVIPLLRDPQPPPKTPHAHISKNDDPKLISSTWALDIRRKLNVCAQSGQHLDNTLVSDLIAELSAAFISALQRNSRHQWMYLVEVLRLCQPYSKTLENDEQLRHYVGRTYYQTRQHNTPTAGSDIDNMLAKVFPRTVLALKSTGGDSKDYRNPLATSGTPAASSQRFNPLSMSLPDGADPYTLERPGAEEKLTPRGINFGHIREVLPSVVMETTRHEAVWSEGLGLTAAAMNLDLNDVDPAPPKPVAPPRIPDPSWAMEDPVPLRDDLAVSETDETELSEDIPLTGKEVVEMFGKGRHLGKAKFIYLNKTRTRHFMPYELSVVPKHKADPAEHWIVSCFGIMHKVRGQPATSQNLYDWHREAVIFGILAKIPFFKHYLVRKTFNRWRSGQKHQEFCNIRKSVHEKLLLAIPGFGAASLQVSKLLQELGTVRFLPLELDHCFSLPEYEHRSRMMFKAGQTILNKFFSYCKLILDKSCEDSFDTLRFCEQQAKKDKALFSKESLFVQRQKKEQRETNMQKAQDETKRLGNFVLLMDQILVCHLLSLTRFNICTFVRHTMAGGFHAPRDALYKAKLVFTNKGALVLSPSKQTILDTCDAILTGLATLISDAAKPMEEVTAGWVGGQREKLFMRGDDDKSDRTSTRMSNGNGRNIHKRYSTTTATDNLQQPILTEKTTPRKESDHLGVATPELCKKTDLQEEFVVIGEGMVGQYNPLTEGSLVDRLLADEEISSARELQTQILSKGLAEIDEFCESLSWLAEIHSFARKWTKDAVNQWKRAQSYTIETKLGEIRDWGERVKNVERSIVTENGLFHIDCGAVQEDLVPLLNNAFRDLLTFTATEAKNLSIEFMTEVKGVVTAMLVCGDYSVAELKKGMKEKTTGVKVFANYAQQYTKYKIRMPDLQKEVEYIKSLFEVIRLSYRSLTPEEEKCEEGVWQNWEAFLLQLQDAAEFVNTQTPIQIGNLDETYQHLYSEAKRISTEASQGIYLDPTQNPMRVLDKLKVLFDEFTSVTNRIAECNDHRQKITGQKYDPSELTSMLQTMTVRSKLWKYVEVTTFGIQEWKHTLFRKFNVTKATTKVTDWQQAAGQLKQVLPQGDQVLAHWYRLLSDFKQDLPLLKKLSSDCLKSRHWKALFLALGQNYEPGRQYYVHELLSYDLSEHSMQINNICAGASAEFDLEQKLSKLKKVWEEKEFKLAKYIAPGKDTFDFEIGDKKGGKKSQPIPDMFTLIGQDQLKYLLEDNQLTLQNMLVSPHLADLRPEAESWASTLRQVEDMLDLWVVCQKKWLYLSQVFSDEYMQQWQPPVARAFEQVDTKYQEVITSVVGDPKVLSILSKRKGMKGHRELQGDLLATLFKNLSNTQDDIFADLDPVSPTNFSLETARRKYPRLCFLSNHELVDLFSVPKDRPKWIPHVRTLFPGVRRLDFESPTSSGSDGISAAFDLLLNADKLQVTAVEGTLGERLPLISPLASKASPPGWLRALETCIKTTMGNMLHSCLETRLRKGTATEDILEELSSIERTAALGSDEHTQQLKQAVHQSFSHWLLRFPSQCVLTGEAILWSREVQPLVKEGQHKQLTEIRDNLQKRLDQYSTILRDNAQSYLASDTRVRLQILLGCLIEQGMHHRDILDDLLQKKELSDHDFDWCRLLRYKMDFKMLLCAQTTVEGEAEAGRKSEASKSILTMTDDTSVTTEKQAALDATLGPRSKTVIGTGFAFGPLQVTQLGADFPYDHEYLGPGPHLVATPLTDRCHLGLTTAMWQRQCGTVVGPAGVGKTETVKELAKFMGQNLVTFDCALDSNIEIVSQFLVGAVQTGSWILLDNTDRLTHSLMAVVSQQLEYLCQAYHILQATGSLYSQKGNSKHDYKVPQTSPRRRHTLTTLHSYQVKDDLDVRRQRTFPSAPNETAKPSQFDDVLGAGEECDVGQFGKRRHSISQQDYVPGEHYDNHVEPVPLFLEMQGPAMIKPQTPRGDDLTEAAYFSPLQEYVYKPQHSGYVSFDSRMVLANNSYACFMTLNTGDHLANPIPDSLKSSMRPVAMVIPDMSIILETVLICSGYEEAPTLAAKLCRLAQMITNAFPEQCDYHLNVGVLKGVVHLATARLFSRRRRFLPSVRSSMNMKKGSQEIMSGSDFDGDFVSGLGEEEEDLHHEESSLVFALRLCLMPHARSPFHHASLRGMLRSVFPWGMGANGRGVGSEHDPVLVDAIQNQFVADNLQATPQHVSKVLELYDSLQHKSGVVLVGGAGSGKTVCYQTLCRVLNSLQTNPPAPEETPIAAPMHGPKVPGLEGVSHHLLSQPMERLRRKAEAVSFMSLHWLDVAAKGADKITYPRVDSSVVYPATLSDKQLIGEFDSSKHQWVDGLVTRLIYDSGQSMETAQVMQKELSENKKKNATKGMLNPPTIIHKWVVVDGVIDPRWAETLGGLIGKGRGLVGGRGKASLSSGERIPMADCTSLLFETSSVTTSSPSTLSRCALIHFGHTLVGWKSLIESWMANAQTTWEVNNNSLQMLQHLIDDTFSRTLEFLANTHSTSALESDLPRGDPREGGVGVGLREVGAFLRIFSAMCDHHLMREKGDGTASTVSSDARLDERHTPRPTLTPTPTPSMVSMTSSGRRTANKTTLLTSMFAFAYVWGFGGHLHDRHTEMFDQFARQLLGRTTHDIILPPEGTVYDIHVDVTLGVLVSWADSNREKMRTVNANFTVTPEAERYFHLLDILVGANQPVLLAGPPGIGKTALMQNMVQPRHHFLSMSMSPVLSCETMEKMLTSKLRPRSVTPDNQQALPPKPGQIPEDPLFFIDDLNCAGMEKGTGEQPCLELLRQLMSEGSIYQRDSLSHYALEKSNYVAACYPPGAQGVGSGVACHRISPRLARLFIVLTYFAPSAESLNLLHAGSLQSWLEEFPAYSLNHHYELAQALIKATMDLHSLVKRQLLISPVNPHYVFSLHDINRIVQGMFLMANRSGRSKGRKRGGGQRSQGKGASNRSRRGRTEKKQTKEGAPPMMRTIIRLWCHEACRTYYDRIVSLDDQTWFRRTLEELVEVHFCEGPPKKRMVTPPMSTLVKEEEGESSQEQESSVHPSTPPSPPLPASPTPTMNTITTGELTAEGSIDQVTGQQDPFTGTPLRVNGDGQLGHEDQSEMSIASVSSLDVPLDLKGDPSTTPPPPPAIVTDLATTPDLPQSPKFLQPVPPPPRAKGLMPTPPSQPAIQPAIKKEGEDSKTRLGPKRGVTFKPGLIHDDGKEEKEDAFKGPLILTNQLKDPGEDLCGITFSKFIPTMGKEGAYMEYTESKLQEGLHRCLSVFNANAQQTMELVFFTESIRHITRLTRILASENTNAVLIGVTNGTGRSSLTRLASHMARCKLYAPQMTRDPEENRLRLRHQIKKASKTAGLIGRPAVLLVKDSMGEECMQDVCCLVQEGSCPDLYTLDELEGLASQMLSGAKATPGQRNQRLEMAQERLLRTVMKNLHVVVCIDCQDYSLASLTERLRKYSILLTNSCSVDTYLPWTQEALARVAQHWLKVPTRDAYTNKRMRLPWPTQFQDRQVNALCQAMAYVHTTSAATTDRLYIKPLRFFTPRNYLDFIDLFKNLTYKITKEEKANVNRFELALDKVNEAFSSIANFRGEIAALDPEYQLAKQRTQEILQEVEECERIFAEAKDNCAEDEKDIVQLQEPLNELKKEAQAELDKVNPVYEAALHALRSLDQSALNELRTYRAPPALVIKVINAVCLMFRQPFDWASGKVLINRKNFFQELEFYDKAAIPNDVFHKLNVLFIQDPAFDPEVVSGVSAAASSLCLWVHAVYAYAVIHRNMRPKLQNVDEAEAKLQEAQGHLGSKRVKAQDMKGLLEQKRKEYQHSLRQVKLCEEKVQVIEAKIAAATGLMNNMEPQHLSWKASLTLAQSRLQTASGDSLLAAACTTYLGPMDEATRDMVLADWLRACRSGSYHLGSGRASAMSGVDPSLAASPALNLVIEANADNHPKPSLSATGGLETLPEHDTPPAEMELPSGMTSDPHRARSEETLASTPRKDGPELPVTPIVTIREDFNVGEILSESEEMIDWKHSSSVVYDQFSADNAMYTRACIIGRRRQWPLIVDPDNIALGWIVKLQERGLPSYHEGEDGEEETELSLGHEGNSDDEELHQSMLTEDRLTESRNLESAATSQFAPSRADASSIGAETDYGTEFPETPRTITTMGGITPRDNASERDFDIYSMGTSNMSVATHPYSVDSDGEQPFFNLWVVSADDDLLESKLVQSVVMGLSLVVTHLERKDIDVKFDELLTRNVRENDEGELVVRIGSHLYSYHPRFALYLTMAVPLELEGAGFLKPHTDRFSVIDMSVSPDGLRTRLLIDVMDAEKPEFANQEHSILADVREHQKNLKETQLDILDKVLELNHGILEDADWLDYLSKHHQMILNTETVLKESRNLLSQLREKQVPYATVAEHGTLLYSTIKKIWQLLPTYYIPLRRFVRWFAKTVRSREKDRTDIASLKARAVELSNALTGEIHAHLSFSLFQQHSDLFVFLVAIERMRSSGEMTEAEWDLFVNGLDSVAWMEQETVFDVTGDTTGVPDWLTNEIWIKCGHLERLAPAYQGLRQSMLRHARQWREYFSCNPVLLAPVPGPDLQDLTFCQKALLWRLVLPDRLARVCRDLVVYELGAHTARPEVYSVQDVLKRTGKNVPLIFVMPAEYHDGEQSGMEGHPVADPLSEIALYVKREDLRTVINTVSLGDAAQMSQAVKALQECVINGNWLVLNNCQAVSEWSNEFLQLIQHIVTPATFVDKTLPGRPEEKRRSRDDLSSEVMSQTAPSQSSVYEGLEVHSDFKLILVTNAESTTSLPAHLAPSCYEGIEVHPNFRLIFITSADNIFLPGLVVQNGMQVACETNTNFKATLRTYFNQAMAAVDQHRHMVTTSQAKSLTELVFCMALLHTVLSHRRLFHQLGFNKDYSWGISDLKAMMSCLNWCQEGGYPWEGIASLRHLITHLVYAGHAHFYEDGQIVSALIDSLLQPWVDLQKAPSSMGAASLLASLVSEMSRGRRSGSSGANMVARRFQHLFDTMQDDVEPAHLGLAASAQELRDKRASRYLSDALQALEHCKPAHQTWFYPSLPKFLLSLDEELSNLPSLTSPSSESLDHLQNFISNEITVLSALIDEVHFDVDLVLKAVVGDAAQSPEVNEILAALSKRIIPEKWKLGGGGVPASRTSVGAWLKEVKERVELLLGYQKGGAKAPACYRLVAFSHPKAFIDAILLEHARKEYLELHQLHMDIEITGMDTPPSTPPSHGVYLSGLHLHNAQWDYRRSAIQLPNTSATAKPHQSSPLPIVWLKPAVIGDYVATAGQKGSPFSTYTCPVFSGGINTEEIHLTSPVLEMDVPCTLDAGLWTQKRVYITNSL